MRPPLSTHPVSERFRFFDGSAVATFDDERRYVGVRPNMPITAEIRRDGQLIAVPMVPKRTEITDQFGNTMELGIIGILTNQESGEERKRSIPMSVRNRHGKPLRTLPELLQPDPDRNAYDFLAECAG